MHGGVMVREQQDRDREQQDAGTQRGRVGWGGEKTWTCTHEKTQFVIV